jgi:hypothetical protein
MKLSDCLVIPKPLILTHGLPRVTYMMALFTAHILYNEKDKGFELRKGLIEMEYGVSLYEQRHLLSELQQLGIVEIRVSGAPPKTRCFLNEKRLFSRLNFSPTDIKFYTSFIIVKDLKEKEYKNIKKIFTKTSQKDKNHKNQFLYLFPPGYRNSPKFRHAWNDFMEMRRFDKKAPVTERSARLISNKIARVGLVTAIKALRVSVENGYRGVFPKRQGGQAQYTPKRPSQSKYKRLHERGKA